MKHCDIIDRLGGIRPLATKLGTYPSKVQGWKDRSSIPMKHVAAILDIAKQERIRLTANDFIGAK